MKKVEITVRKEEYPKVKPLMEDLHSTESELDGVIHFLAYIPDQLLDEFIIKVRDVIDLRYKDNLIDVSTPDFVVSTHLQRAAEQLELRESPTPIEELVISTRIYASLDYGRVAITSIGGLVALTGLFLNNTAIVIGAMILSPILGPISAFAIMTAVGEIRDALRCIGTLAVLLGSVIFFSFLSTAIISLFFPLTLTPEITSRIVTNPIYVIMAVLLGFAIILALTREISETFAGIAVAAALIPPTVVVGLLLVLDPSSALKAAILVLENVIGLMAGTLLATAFLRLAPRARGDRTVARKIMIRALVVFSILIVVLLIISTIV
ncbi:MAG: TIGR00341 family protein [Methanomicrobiaceae archaeon]|nr:TIGR00341 family protein [Methanomicrobiaceae archaeon]